MTYLDEVYLEEIEHVRFLIKFDLNVICEFDLLVELPFHLLSVKNCVLLFFCDSGHQGGLIIDLLGIVFTFQLKLLELPLAHLGLA